MKDLDHAMKVSRELIHSASHASGTNRFVSRRIGFERIDASEGIAACAVGWATGEKDSGVFATD